MSLKPNGIILKATDFNVQGKHVYISASQTNGVPGMLLIWGDWCSHCHHFLPTFNDIAKSIGSGYCCASIESKELKGQDTLTSALDFKGFPTICFFDQHGMVIGQYDGARDKKSVLDAICKTYHHCFRH